MKREDILRGPRLNCYISAHVESWYAFASMTDIDLDGQDLMLVTGRDTTRQWAVAAFTQKKKECAIEFHAGFPGVSAHGLLAGSWANVNSVEHRSGPKHQLPSTTVASIEPTIGDLSLESSAHASAASSSHDQTVFLRGVYVRPRRFGAPPKIKAAAEPRFDNSDSDTDDGESTSSCNSSLFLEDDCLSIHSVTDHGESSDLDNDLVVRTYTLMQYDTSIL